MSRIDEIRKRLTEDQSALPTREEVDYLLSLLDAVSGVIDLDVLGEIVATAPTETSARCGECERLRLRVLELETEIDTRAGYL
jgi:hypothetical protein